MNAVLLNTIEDLNWLFDVHAPRWRDLAKSAILEGNEDCPERIILYDVPEPMVDDVPLITIHKESQS